MFRMVGYLFESRLRGPLLVMGIVWGSLSSCSSDSKSAPISDSKALESSEDPTVPEPVQLRPAPVEGRPDLVIVTLDTTRADQLSVYGYPRPTTPFLEELAEKGTVFERCLAPVATTLPTHTSLFTGLWPLEHGVLSNLKGKAKRYKPPEGMLRLAEVMQASGYRTGAFISALPLRRRFGLAPGFEVYDEPVGMVRRGERTTHFALEWLKKQTSEDPVFLWVHYFDPHSPYEPIAPFDELFQDDETSEAYLAPRGFHERAVRPTGQENVLRPGLHAYNGELAYTDDQVRELWGGLRARGRLEETVWVVISDHGEGLNQHNAPGHGLTWNEHLHVPWIMGWPGAEARRIDSLVSVIDVVPTLSGLLQLPGLDALERQASGRDVLEPNLPPLPILALSSERQEQFGNLTVALTGTRWKTIWDDGEAQMLFDLSRDPFELNDVAEDYPDVAASMRLAINELREAQLAKGRDLDAGQTADLSEEDVQGLRGLGYLGDEDEY